MNRRLVAVAVAFGLIVAAVVPFVRQSHAAGCRWGQIGIGCNANDCLILTYANPSPNCSGSTVDVQKSDCGANSWTTIQTNVTSPVTICPATSAAQYRLVCHCACGADTISAATPCYSCPDE